MTDKLNTALATGFETRWQEMNETQARELARQIAEQEAIRRDGKHIGIATEAGIIAERFASVDEVQAWGDANLKECMCFQTVELQDE